MNKLSIQYISDIHLEFYTNDTDFHIEAHSPNLALCGDIGYPGFINYINFINKCATMFKNVFVIYGNHEFYNKQNALFIETIDDRKNYNNNFPKNVYFLDNKIVYLNVNTNIVQENIKNETNKTEYVKIIGSTLWSNIDYHTSLLMNDTKVIYNHFGIPLQWYDIKNMYFTNKNWITDQITKEKDIKCILLTHHPVHPVFIDRYSQRMLLYKAYCNEIPELYRNNNLLACISGHTHNNINTYLYFEGGHKIYFLSNQVGYTHLSHSSDNMYDKANDKSNCLFQTFL